MTFRVGDEVVCVDAAPPLVLKGSTYTVEDVYLNYVVLVGVAEANAARGMLASRFRKVERRKDGLSIESFLTIKPGFEEPRRPKAPAKKRERAQ